jgi:histone H3/H4
VRPESARGILRQLAKLTAPTTNKIVPTPGTVKGKENRSPDEDDGERLGKRPRLNLDIDDSLESIDAPEVGSEEDSELPPAPTPSILPDEDNQRTEIERDNPTFTLKSIEYGGDAESLNADRPLLRRSFPASDPVIYQGEEESTFLSERGRRAPTLEPTEALSHYDFGTINIEEATRAELSKSPEKTQLGLADIERSYTPVGDGGNETEVLQHLQDFHSSPSLGPLHESNMEIPTFDDTNFQLPEPELEATSKQGRADPAVNVAEASFLQHDPDEVGDGWESDDEHDEEHEVDLQANLDEESDAVASAEAQHLQAQLDKPASTTRRTKMKLTRHGEMVPSLPSNLIKRVAIEAQERLGNRRPKLGKDHMKALEQATEWFFEQVGEDLEAYSNHARRRKRIDQSDVLLLMRRQRILQNKGELLKAAEEFLPEEVVAELDFETVSEA